MNYLAGKYALSCRVMWCHAFSGSCRALTVNVNTWCFRAPQLSDHLSLSLFFLSLSLSYPLISNRWLCSPTCRRRPSFLVCCLSDGRSHASRTVLQGTCWDTVFCPLNIVRNKAGLLLFAIVSNYTPHGAHGVLLACMHACEGMKFKRLEVATVLEAGSGGSSSLGIR